MLNALTIDVEEHFHANALVDAVPPSRWAGTPSRVQDNTLRLLDLLAEHEVKATFFVLGWVARRQPHLVRRIAAAGHEVACHGYSHSLVFNQSPEQFRSETRSAKALLEDLTGGPILGYRAATYSITRKSLWALDVLYEEGFSYDSSIVPARHDVYGIPDFEVAPHRLKTPAGYPLLEFPISVTPLFGMNIPVAGGGYFRLFPYVLSRWGLRAVNRSGRPAIFYLHPWEVDPQQPRYALPWRSRFRHYNQLAAMQPRLRRLLRDFDFSTAAQVLTSGGFDLRYGAPPVPHYGSA